MSSLIKIDLTSTTYALQYLALYDPLLVGDLPGLNG